MNWTWDRDKARINSLKHHVSFELARRVFDDPFHLSRLDPYPHEERWRTLGIPGGVGSVVLFVVHTEPGEAGHGRIISARKATAHERKAYEQGQD